MWVSSSTTSTRLAVAAGFTSPCDCGMRLVSPDSESCGLSAMCCGFLLQRISAVGLVLVAEFDRSGRNLCEWDCLKSSARFLHFHTSSNTRLAHGTRYGDFFFG